jgi:hypothetical protein
MDKTLEEQCLRPLRIRKNSTISHLTGKIAYYVSEYLFLIERFGLHSITFEGYLLFILLKTDNGKKAFDLMVERKTFDAAKLKQNFPALFELP